MWFQTMNLDDLKRINTEINALPYDFHVEELWEMPKDNHAACSNYAVAKYRRLIEQGWAFNTLRLACCYVETGEYHAVLCVDYEGQTWVLDNRHPYPMEYDMLPYKFHKVQVAGTPQWEGVA